MMNSAELETWEIIGIVETDFEALNGTDERTLFRKGLNELLNIAKQRYAGEIRVRNVVLKRSSSKKNSSVLIETGTSGGRVTPSRAQ